MDAEEGLNSDFDLNSLIEGHVDNDDFWEEFVTALEGPDEKEKAASVVTFLEPLKVGVTLCITLTLGCFVKRARLVHLCLEHLLGRQLFATSDLRYVRKQG